MINDMEGNLVALEDFYRKCCHTVRGHASPMELTPAQLDKLFSPSLRKQAHDAIRHDMKMQDRIKWNARNENFSRFQMLGSSQWMMSQPVKWQTNQTTLYRRVPSNRRVHLTASLLIPVLPKVLRLGLPLLQDMWLEGHPRFKGLGTNRTGGKTQARVPNGRRAIGVTPDSSGTHLLAVHIPAINGKSTIRRMRATQEDERTLPGTSFQTERLRVK